MRAEYNERQGAQPALAALAELEQALGGHDISREALAEILGRISALRELLGGVVGSASKLAIDLDRLQWSAPDGVGEFVPTRSRGLRVGRGGGNVFRVPEQVGKTALILTMLRDEFGIDPYDTTQCLPIKVPSGTGRKRLDSGEYRLLLFPRLGKSLLVNDAMQNDTYVLHTADMDKVRMYAAMPKPQLRLAAYNGEVSCLGWAADEGSALGAVKSALRKSTLELTAEVAKMGEGIMRLVLLMNNEGIDPQTGKKVVALAVFTPTSRLYHWAMNRVRDGRLRHVKGLRGDNGSELVKVFKADEMSKLKETYESRIVLDDEGKAEIEGRVLIGLPAFLLKTGLSYKVAMATLDGVKSSGIEPTDREVFMGSKIQTAYFLDEVALYLPAKLDENATGYIYEKTDEGTAPRKTAVTSANSYAMAKGCDPKGLLRRIAEAGVKPVPNKIISQKGGANVHGYKVDDIKWLLPQHPSADGRIDLQIAGGGTVSAIVVSLAVTDTDDLRAVRTALRKRDILQIPHVCVQDREVTTKTYSALPTDNALPVINKALARRGKALISW